MVAKQYQRNLGGLYLNEGDPEAWCEAGSNGGAVTHPPADPAGSFGRARFRPRPPEPPPGPSIVFPPGVLIIALGFLLRSDTDRQSGRILWPGR